MSELQNQLDRSVAFRHPCGIAMKEHFSIIRQFISGGHKLAKVAEREPEVQQKLDRCRDIALAARFFSVFRHGHILPQREESHG